MVYRNKSIVDDVRVAKFVGQHFGHAFEPPFTCMGLEKDGEIVAGVVFNIFEAADVHVSVAGKGWDRYFLAELGQYAYGTLNKERVTVITEHTKVVRLAEKLGGKIEGCLRNHFGKGRDAFIVGILRDEYRF